MKRVISIIIIIMTVFYITPSFSYASSKHDIGKETDIYKNTTFEKAEDIQDEFSKEDITSIQDEGSVEALGEQRYIRGTDSSSVAMAGTLARVLTFFPWTASQIMTSLVNSTGDRQEEYSTTPEGLFTIENLVFDRYEILNGNYFVYNSSKVNYEFKSNIKNWYTGTMVIAIAGALVTLIYMGIRMGISTVASDKAKYKKMLFDWAIGFVMIFVLHFVIIFMSNISTQITYIFSENVEPATLESNIIEYNMAQMQKAKGWGVVSETIIYTVLVFYQVRFFIVYVKRFLMIGLLIVIAPLMTITYAIDRAGDQKSQIFNTWFKEISVNLLVQPLHAMLYLVFMHSAGRIAAVAPILAIAFLMVLSRGEKIVKGIFNLRKLKSINSTGATLNIAKSQS